MQTIWIEIHGTLYEVTVKGEFAQVGATWIYDAIAARAKLWGDKVSIKSQRP